MNICSPVEEHQRFGVSNPDGLHKITRMFRNFRDHIILCISNFLSGLGVNSGSWLVFKVFNIPSQPICRESCESNWNSAPQLLLLRLMFQDLLMILTVIIWGPDYRLESTPDPKGILHLDLSQKVESLESSVNQFTRASLKAVSFLTLGTQHSFQEAGSSILLQVQGSSMNHSRAPPLSVQRGF